jgi:ribosomal protein S18 acetylase RimI-like enzyme
MNYRISQADLSDPRDAKSLVDVLNSYASDPVGGGVPLSDDVCRRMPTMLREMPTALVLLAYNGDEAVGVAICFFALSTFSARPLVNIHDLAVIPQYRGQGIGRALLTAIEEHAKRKGCCKLTLEVQDDNTPARTLYQRFGFEDVIYGNSAVTRFLAKKLDA